MPALTLPLTFSNSFWSEDYRRGLETIFNKLQQGVEENEEIIAFIRARASAEYALANSLIDPPPTGPRGTGFDADDGASLLMAFRGLQAESAAQGEVHKTIAKELQTLVADPFDEWARGHKERITGRRNSLIDGWLKAYEVEQGNAEKLKHTYLSKVRKADEAEDDAKFAPNSKAGDNYTSSPRLQPHDRRNPQRTVSVSERIAQRFKELQQKATNSKPTHQDSTDTVSSEKSASATSEAESEEKLLPKVDKGKGRAVDEAPVLASPSPMSPALSPAVAIDARGSSPMPPPPPPPILLAGLALPPSAVSDLLKRAASELPLRPVKFPIIGEYKDCFTGEEFATWLVDNVQGFGSSLDRAEDAARDLCEREGVLRRVGEFGNAFENNEEAFYQFRQKAFNLEAEYAKREHHDGITSPVVANLVPMADNLVKRSNTLVNIVQKAINERHSEPYHIRARAEAKEADKAYRVAVRKLDRHRLGLEERIEETLKAAQRWELDRLRAVKTVLLQYHGTLANLPSGLQPSLDRSSTLIAGYQPEGDLRALIESYRTGPFKPHAHVYESITHDEADVYFGIDLRKWADGGWSALRGGATEKETVPEVLTALLKALDDVYPKLPNDSEKRKTWIYEVPLSAVHHLRESINGISPGLPIPEEMLAKYDAPVLASTVKLWALELNPPLCTWEGWDDIRRIYPTVGSGNTTEETNSQQHLQDLQVALLRLPKIHLLVLDALFKHIKTLIDSTTVEEDNDVYITKLALSMGRTILRPKVENELSIQDRHPTMLFIDLVKNFDEIIPPTIARKKRESDRKIPLRKRTAPIDMRMSRSRLSVGADTREILEAQLVAKNPSMRPSSRAPSPAPAPPIEAPLPPVPAPESFASVLESAKSPATAPAESVSVAEVPAPAVSPAPAPAPTPPSTLAEDPNALPPMPVFKEPPPETDDAPPMPKFADPPPEVESEAPTPPPASIPSPPPPESPSVPVTVSAATPPRSSPSPARSRSPTGSRSRSPTGSSVNSSIERVGASLARSGSGEASRLRGPRGARSARPQSGNVASLVGQLHRGNGNGSGTAGSQGASGLSRHTNRASFGGRSGSPVNPQDYEPKRKGARTQAGAFSRRTMASDAEEDVVQQ